MQRLLAETNKVCHAARAQAKKCPDKRALATFLSSHDALFAAGLAANPQPVGRKRDYLEAKSYNIAVALREHR